MEGGCEGSEEKRVKRSERESGVEVSEERRGGREGDDEIEQSSDEVLSVELSGG